MHMPILPILTIPLVVLATSLEQSENEDQITNVVSNTHLRLKFGENRCSGFPDNVSEMFI